MVVLFFFFCFFFFLFLFSFRLIAAFIYIYFTLFIYVYFSKRKPYSVERLLCHKTQPTYSVAADMLDCSIIVNECKLQLYYYIHV